MYVCISSERRYPCSNVYLSSDLFNGMFIVFEKADK